MANSNQGFEDEENNGISEDVTHNAGTSDTGTNPRNNRYIGSENRETAESIHVPPLLEEQREQNLTRIQIEDSVTQTADETSCCSWSRMCDVLGNRQGNFIVSLRPLRAHLIHGQQSLKAFQLELDRGIRTRHSTKATAEAVRNAVQQLNNLTMHQELNIPPEENEMLRQLSYDLAVLWRIIEELYRTTPIRDGALVNEGVERVQKGRMMRDVATGNPVVDEVPNTSESDSSWNKGSLKERIARNSATMEKLIRFIDRKTERRWWLRDVINFLQVSIKLALFISAAISVAYHEEQIAPIVTLVIALLQGIVEMLDQYFLKHTKPEEIKLSVAATMTAIENRGT